MSPTVFSLQTLLSPLSLSPTPPPSFSVPQCSSPLSTLLCPLTPPAFSPGPVAPPHAGCTDSPLCGPAGFVRGAAGREEEQQEGVWSGEPVVDAAQELPARLAWLRLPLPPSPPALFSGNTLDQGGGCNVCVRGHTDPLPALPRDGASPAPAAPVFSGEAFTFGAAGLRESPAVTSRASSWADFGQLGYSLGLRMALFAGNSLEGSLPIGGVQHFLPNPLHGGTPGLASVWDSRGFCTSILWDFWGSLSLPLGTWADSGGISQLLGAPVGCGCEKWVGKRKGSDLWVKTICLGVAPMEGWLLGRWRWPLRTDCKLGRRFERGKFVVIARSVFLSAVSPTNCGFSGLCRQTNRQVGRGWLERPQERTQACTCRSPCLQGPRCLVQPLWCCLWPCL